MRAALDTMTDRELLMELVEDKRRQERYRNIKLAVIGVIVLAVVILLIRVVPPVVRTFRQVDGFMQSLESADFSNTIQNLEQEIDSIRGEFSGAMDKVSELESSFGKIQELGSKLEGIDFDGLSEVINKLGNLVNKFPFLFN